MATFTCEGTYHIIDSQIAHGYAGFYDKEEEALRLAEERARAAAEDAGAKLAAEQSCEGPCENPPWYRVTMALVDNESDAHTMPGKDRKVQYSAHAVVVWQLDISCRKRLPLQTPKGYKKGGGAYYVLVGRRETRARKRLVVRRASKKKRG
jgi:hypothetical protein